MIRSIAAAAAVCALTLGGAARATPITYEGHFGSGEDIVSFVVTTDGRTGYLTTSDITYFKVMSPLFSVVEHPMYYSYSGFDSAHGSVGIYGARAVYADSGNLYFNFNYFDQYDPNASIVGFGFSGDVYDDPQYEARLCFSNNSCGAGLPSYIAVSNYFSPGGEPAQSYEPTFGNRIAVAGAPEPGTWALMVMGIGLGGVALRRRAKPVMG